MSGREANDHLRKTFTGGVVVCSPDILAIPEEIRAGLLRYVRNFEFFHPFDDSNPEHEVGTFEIGDDRFRWHIRSFEREPYYRGQEIEASNPADVETTIRVLWFGTDDEEGNVP